MKEDFIKLLQDAATETGATLQANLEDLATFAEQRTEHLKTMTADPHFPMAVRAERDAVALRAGINASRQGSAADQRLLGLIQGALAFAAKVAAA